MAHQYIMKPIIKSEEKEYYIVYTFNPEHHVRIQKLYEYKSLPLSCSIIENLDPYWVAHTKYIEDFRKHPDETTEEELNLLMLKVFG